jgi:hypothetical protein
VISSDVRDQLAWARFHTGDGTAPDGAYEFLKQPKHATLVPGFTEIPGLCEMLGGHTIVD